MKPINTLVRYALTGAVLIVFAGSSAGAEKVLEARVLEKMAKEAVSPSQHATVAKQYRLRAESLEQKAAEHDATANKLRTVHNPLAHKWPAIGNQAVEREKKLAMQARRAAQECSALADRHIRLAVEGDLAE